MIAPVERFRRIRIVSDGLLLAMAIAIMVGVELVEIDPFPSAMIDMFATGVCFTVTVGSFAGVAATSSGGKPAGIDEIARDERETMPERFTVEETLASMEPGWKPAGPEPEVIAKTLGRRFGQRRFELGYTLGMVGERAGLSVSFLSEFQSGKRGISAENLLRIATVLECTPDWFYGELVDPLGWKRR